MLPFKHVQLWSVLWLRRLDCDSSIYIQTCPPHTAHCVLTVFLVVVNRDNQTFAATRPSAVLLEQLAVCVLKGEPVLLVGETGTGKTSTVQHLARVKGEHRFICLSWAQTGGAELGCGSAGRACRPLIAPLVVGIPAPPVHALRYPWSPNCFTNVYRWFVTVPDSNVLCVQPRTQAAGCEHEPAEWHCWPARRVSEP